jgi:hypothetical protein
MGSHEWTRNERPAELFVHQGTFGQPESDSTSLFGQAQSEHAGVAQGLPTVTVYDPLGRFASADDVERELALAQSTDAIDQLGLRLVDLEIHD